MVGSVVTSSSVSTSWNGTFFQKGAFQDKFKVIDKNYDTVLDTYEVVIMFSASPDKLYTFDVPEKVYYGGKQVLADEILRQLTQD